MQQLHSMGCDSHVSALGLAMHQHIHVNGLLLLDGVLHVLVHMLLILLSGQLALLELQAGTADLCMTRLVSAG